MKAKVALVARVNDGTGAFPCIAARIARRGIVLPVERKDGRLFEPDSIIGFYARYPRNGKRVVEPLGKDPVDAFARFLKIDQDFVRIRAGLLPVNEPAVDNAPQKASRNIAACAREFKADLASRGRKPRSIESYSGSIDNFLASYPKESIDDVDRSDMIAFIDWMRRNLEKRKGGHPHNTYRNRLRDVTIFLKFFGVEMPLKTREWPKEVKPKKEKYAISTVNEMLKAAETEEEKDLIHFLVKTGFRDDEVAHAQYGDINFKHGTINVSAKPEYNWTPKDNEPRDEPITLESRFIERMKARRARYNAKSSDLIFPNKVGKPNMHLIRVIQYVAKRAGIDVRIGLHKFRKTFGTMVAHKYGLEQARIWLGHDDIATTQAYIAADEMTTEQSREAMDEMFAAVGD